MSLQLPASLQGAAIEGTERPVPYFMDWRSRSAESPVPTAGLTMRPVYPNTPQVGLKLPAKYNPSSINESSLGGAKLPAGVDFGTAQVQNQNGIGLDQTALNALKAEVNQPTRPLPSQEEGGLNGLMNKGVNWLDKNKDWAVPTALAAPVVLGSVLGGMGNAGFVRGGLRGLGAAAGAGLGAYGGSKLYDLATEKGWLNGLDDNQKGWAQLAALLGGGALGGWGGYKVTKSLSTSDEEDREAAREKRASADFPALSQYLEKKASLGTIARYGAGALGGGLGTAAGGIAGGMLGNAVAGDAKDDTSQVIRGLMQLGGAGLGGTLGAIGAYKGVKALTKTDAEKLQEQIESMTPEQQQALVAQFSKTANPHNL